MTRLDFLFKGALFFLAIRFTQAVALKCTTCEDPGGDNGPSGDGSGTTRKNSPFTLSFSLFPFFLKKKNTHFTFLSFFFFFSFLFSF